MPTTASSPRTLINAEQRRLLEATARNRRDYRDHVIYSLALATGLREHELAGLDVGDVYVAEGAPAAGSASGYSLQEWQAIGGSGYGCFLRGAPSSSTRQWALSLPSWYLYISPVFWSKKTTL